MFHWFDTLPLEFIANATCLMLWRPFWHVTFALYATSVCFTMESGILLWSSPLSRTKRSSYLAATAIVLYVRGLYHRSTANYVSINYLCILILYLFRTISTLNSVFMMLRYATVRPIVLPWNVQAFQSAEMFKHFNAEIQSSYMSCLCMFLTHSRCNYGTVLTVLNGDRFTLYEHILCEHFSITFYSGKIHSSRGVGEM